MTLNFSANPVLGGGLIAMPPIELTNAIASGLLTKVSQQSLLTVLNLKLFVSSEKSSLAIGWH